MHGIFQCECSVSTKSQPYSLDSWIYCSFAHQRIVSNVVIWVGLNTMQGREAKHIKLKKYIENTSNVQKSQRWEHVF